MVALRIPEGIFLTDYMIWVQGFSHCRCQNCLVILKPLESTKSLPRQPLPCQVPSALFCVLFGAKEKYWKRPSYM